MPCDLRSPKIRIGFSVDRVSFHAPQGCRSGNTRNHKQHNHQKGVPPAVDKTTGLAGSMPKKSQTLTKAVPSRPASPPREPLTVAARVVSSPNTA